MFVCIFCCLPPSHFHSAVVWLLGFFWAVQQLSWCSSPWYKHDQFPYRRCAASRIFAFGRQNLAERHGRFGLHHAFREQFLHAVSVVSSVDNSAPIAGVAQVACRLGCFAGQPETGVDLRASGGARAVQGQTGIGNYPHETLPSTLSTWWVPC